MTWLTYSVVKFVPDPVKDERVNIGVIVSDDERQFATKFIDNFELLKERYSILGIDLLKSIVSSYDVNLRDRKRSLEDLHKSSLKNNRIWVESPRATNSASIEEAVSEIYSQMISIPEKQDGRRIQNSLDKKIEDVLYNKLGMEKRHVRRSCVVEGMKTNGKFHYVFGNGHITDILQRISFDVRNKDHALQQVKSFVYDSSDIHKKSGKINCIAYMPIPKNPCAQHKEAINILNDSDDCILVDDGSLMECLMEIRKRCGYMGGTRADA